MREEEVYNAIVSRGGLPVANLHSHLKAFEFRYLQLTVSPTKHLCWPDADRDPPFDCRDLRLTSGDPLAYLGVGPSPEQR